MFGSQSNRECSSFYTFIPSPELGDLNAITIVQKVLECLVIHRSITEKQIDEFLNSKQRLIEKKLVGKISVGPDFVQNQTEFHCAITPANIKKVIDRYTLSESHIRDKLKQSDDVFDYDEIVKKYLEFLSRLVIVRIDCADEPRYELSLLGVMLILAIVTHPHQKMFHKDNELKNNEDLEEFYSMVSQNYADKLPLVFGKWALLTKTRDYAYRWFLPVLYQNIENEFTRAIRPGSITVILGGIKDYKETMQDIAFHTTARLFDLFRGLSLALHHSNKINSEIPPILDGQIQQQAGFLALEQKQKELAALLKYADLSQFMDKLKDNKKSTQHLELVYNSELSIIEKALASEVTFLFYINLARNRFLDYTDEGRLFLGDERDTDYQDYQETINYQDYQETTEIHIQKPIDFLRIILKSDNELMDTFLKWIADIRNYRRRSSEHMEQFETTVKKWKNRPN